MGQVRPNTSPSVFGRYQTLFRIAAGGMAEVYAARVRGEAGFEKLVALKRMLPHLTDDERFVTMFMDEGKLAANISSPNVVSTLDLGRADDGSLYLVMELVVGTTLSTLLRNAAKGGESIDTKCAVEMLAQAAQGLHDAHEAKTPFGAPLRIVHRDISPQNILVGTDGRVRITDFGVARAILRRTKTSTGEFKGKLSYFSPEQCADQNLDRRSDLFSLGVVAWETLTTRRLFHAENPLAVLERVTRMPIPSAHTVRPDVPQAVADVVAKALERDRENRYSTAADFARALRDAAKDTTGLADRHDISTLVDEQGGDSLARIQDQLKKSLSSNAPVHDELSVENERTEISSGIVFRQEDGPPVPATPRMPAVQPPNQNAIPAVSFTGNMAGSTRQRAPLIVAAIVATLGLGAGVTIGVMASDGADASTTEADLPEVDSLPTEDETPVAVVAEDPDEDEPDTPAADTDETPAANAGRPARRPRRFARRPRGPPRRPEPDAVPAPVVGVAPPPPVAPEPVPVAAPTPTRRPVRRPQRPDPQPAAPPPNRPRQPSAGGLVQDFGGW